MIAIFVHLCGVFLLLTINVSFVFGSDGSAISQPSTGHILEILLRTQEAQREYEAGKQYLENHNKNDRLAIQGLEPAANKGHPGAQYELAELFFKRKLYQRAFYWYEKVFTNKNLGSFNSAEGLIRIEVDYKIEAAYKMGIILFKGLGRPPDLELAFEKLDYAQEYHSGAKYYMALWYRRLGPNKEYMVTRLLEASAMEGYVIAQYELAEKLYQKKDYEKAYYWFAQVVRNNKKTDSFEETRIKQINAEAAYKMGLMKYKASGVPQDLPLAVRHLQYAVNKDHREAMYHLAMVYEKLNADRNLLIIPLLEQTASKGHPGAQYELAVIYLKDPEQRQKAVSLLEAAVQQKYLKAEALLSRMEDGIRGDRLSKQFRRHIENLRQRREKRFGQKNTSCRTTF